MNEPRLRLGDILVESGLLTQEKLNHALEIQRHRPLRLGAILIQERLIPEQHLMQALSRHLAIPWVSLQLIDIPDDILKLVPVNVAEDFFLIPIYVRTEKRGERALYVAMNDPSDQDALRFVQATSGLPVKPMLAAPSDIATAIRYFYYDEEVLPVLPDESEAISPDPAEDTMEELSDDLIEMVSIESTVPAKEDTTEQISAPVHEEVSSSELFIDPSEPSTGETAPKLEPMEPTPEKPTPEKPMDPTTPEADSATRRFEDKTSAQREAERILYGVGHRKPARGFALTLLDGTTLSFSATPSQPAPSTDKPTRDELIERLSSAARGDSLDHPLPAEKWQSYLAVLLDLLMQKGFVLYDEFYERIKEIEQK